MHRCARGTGHARTCNPSLTFFPEGDVLRSPSVPRASLRLHVRAQKSVRTHLALTEGAYVRAIGDRFVSPSVARTCTTSPSGKKVREGDKICAEQRCEVLQVRALQQLHIRVHVRARVARTWLPHKSEICFPFGDEKGTQTQLVLRVRARTCNPFGESTGTCSKPLCKKICMHVRAHRLHVRAHRSSPKGTHSPSFRTNLRFVSPSGSPKVREGDATHLRCARPVQVQPFSGKKYRR